MTTQETPGIFNLFRQMMGGGQSMAQRAGIFSKLVGKVALSATTGPLGLGLMAGGMMLPMMMSGGGKGNAQNAEKTGSALDRLAEELDEVTSGLHRMNVEVKQLSDAVGQTSTDTLKMSAQFASIGVNDPLGQAGSFSSQMGRQMGSMRMGQINPSMLMGASMLGLNPREMMDQSPAEILNSIVDELRKLNKTELKSVDTLARIEMVAPGQGQNLIAMANLTKSQLASLRDREAMAERFSDGAMGRALEKQSQNLLAIAAGVQFNAEMFQREREYLKSPFAEERATRGEGRAVMRQQFGLGWQEGLQGSKVVLESWATGIHTMFKRIMGEGTGSRLRTLGDVLGEAVSGLLELVHAGVVFGSWVKDVVKLIYGILESPMKLGSGDAFKTVKEAWAGMNFQGGTMTGDLAIAMDDAHAARRTNDARMAVGMRPGLESTGHRGMGKSVETGERLVLEVQAKDDFSNMLQYGIRQNTNQGRDVPGPVSPRTPSIASR